MTSLISLQASDASTFAAITTRTTTHHRPRLSHYTYYYGHGALQASLLTCPHAPDYQRDRGLASHLQWRIQKWFKGGATSTRLKEFVPNLVLEPYFHDKHIHYIIINISINFIN
jgi:hypothetical protein